jgi:hypothetical protein
MFTVCDSFYNPRKLNIKFKAGAGAASWCGSGSIKNSAAPDPKAVFNNRCFAKQKTTAGGALGAKRK